MRLAAPILLFLVLALQLFLVDQVLAAAEISVPVAHDNEIAVDRYPARGDYLLIWLAPEYGFRKAHRSMAQRLRGQGIEAALYLETILRESRYLEVRKAASAQLRLLREERAREGLPGGVSAERPAR